MVEAPNEEEAIGQLPSYVARRTTVKTVTEIRIP